MMYLEFIDNILQTRGRFSCGDEYHERHHITPKCMSGVNDENNLIDLFAREHFEAHRLLALDNPENEKLVYAWWNMCSFPGSAKKREKVTPEEYEEARKAYAEKFSGGNNPSAKRIVRLSDEKIYYTLRSCYKDNNISSNTLWNMLKQHRNFVYYDEWANMSDLELEKLKLIDWNEIEHKNRSDAAKRSGNGGSAFCQEETRKKIGEANKQHGIKVYCPELDEFFITMKSAADKYNICRESIRLCLCGKQKHAGRHPVTGELLSWVKLENKSC